MVEDVKRAVSKRRMRYYPLLDEQGRYIGMFSQRNLLDLERPSVILVDHNERDQAADGIRSTNIIEIIDHHRIDSVETSGPIYFRNQPLGCTATIITGMYHEHNVPIEPKIAGLLCSAILSDTLMFRSPTCTPLDRAAAEELAQIAGLDIREYATEMFRSSSCLRDRSMDELFHMDFKYFQVQNKKIAISQITSVSENELNGIRDKMLDYMEDYLKTSGLSMQFVMLTDIIEEKDRTALCRQGRKGSGAYRVLQGMRGAFGRAAGCSQPQKADGNAAAQRNGGGRDHVRRKCLVLRAGAVRAIRNESPVLHNLCRMGDLCSTEGKKQFGEAVLK